MIKHGTAVARALGLRTNSQGVVATTMTCSSAARIADARLMDHWEPQ